MWAAQGEASRNRRLIILTFILTLILVPCILLFQWRRVFIILFSRPSNFRVHCFISTRRVVGQSRLRPRRVSGNPLLLRRFIRRDPLIKVILTVILNDLPVQFSVSGDEGSFSLP